MDINLVVVQELGALEEPLNIAAEKAPLAIIMLAVIIVLAWSFRYSVKKLSENYDEARKDLKENSEKAVELLKEYFDKRNK